MSARATRSSIKTAGKDAQPSRDAGEIKTQPSRICFYGKHNFLSNVFPAKFLNPDNGKHYDCVEQFMQAAKAQFFDDQITLTSTMKATKPKQQKNLGRRVKPSNEEQWAEVSYDVVVKGVYLKFTTSETASSLTAQLLATGNAELVESSVTDKILGVGLSIAAANEHEGDWPGQNKLGLALMIVRSQLKKEAELKAIKPRITSSKPDGRTGQKNATAAPPPLAPKKNLRDKEEEEEV